MGLPWLILWLPSPSLLSIVFETLRTLFGRCRFTTAQVGRCLPHAAHSAITSRRPTPCHRSAGAALAAVYLAGDALTIRLGSCLLPVHCTDLHLRSVTNIDHACCRTTFLRAPECRVSVRSMRGVYTLARPSGLTVDLGFIMTFHDQRASAQNKESGS